MLARVRCEPPQDQSGAGATAGGGQASTVGVGVVDLFSGAGGLSLGLQQGGLTVLLGSDNWKPAAETYRHNLTDHPFLEVDARELSATAIKSASLGLERLVVVGGPPCQGFTSAGARRDDDRRNTLVGVFSRLAVEAAADIIVFENVEGFLTAGGGSYVTDLLDPLIEAGYYISLRKVNVANYGVPQHRKRVICIAARGRAPVDLVPTHRAFGAPGASRVARCLPVTRTLADALQGLPEAATRPPGSPTLHYSPHLSALDERRMAALQPGQTMRDLPRDLQHESYQRRAYRRVMDGTPTERRGGAPAGLRRLKAEEPSKAITSAAIREFIHPILDRPMTLRECARIQTFPDWFDFLGTRSHCATMIGNAVPPAFAHTIAGAIASTAATSRQESGRGRIVRFDPTVSEGMSPALAAVVAAVARRYGERGPSHGADVPSQLEIVLEPDDSAVDHLSANS